MKTVQSEMERICAVTGLRPSRRQVYASQFLEGMGQRFLVHFGLHNCEQQAADAWVAVKERAE